MLEKGAYILWTYSTKGLQGLNRNWQLLILVLMSHGLYPLSRLNNRLCITMSFAGYRKVALKLKTILFRLSAFKRHSFMRTQDMLQLAQTTLVSLQLAESWQVKGYCSAYWVIKLQTLTLDFKESKAVRTPTSSSAFPMIIAGEINVYLNVLFLFMNYCNIIAKSELNEAYVRSKQQIIE